MFSATLGAVAPLSLAVKAIGTAASVTSAARNLNANSGFDTIAKAANIAADVAASVAPGNAPDRAPEIAPDHAPGDANPGDAHTMRRTTGAEASAPLPPPPAMSQMPISRVAPTVEGIHDLYAQVRALRH